MTEQTAKLPALYVLDPLKPGFIEAMPSPGQFVGHDPKRIFKYVPARECKTCAKFQQEPDSFDGGTMQRFCTRSHLLVEPDEYCSRHEPREGNGDAKG